MTSPYPATPRCTPLEGRELGLGSRWGILSASIPVGLCLVLGLCGSLAAETVGAAQDWWAFQPLTSPPIPRVVGVSSDHAIDAFVLNRLRAKSLRLSPQASPRELLRRLHIDLVGLPPTPEEIAAFERDPSPEAWSRRVEALLASPRYGERWGRHWLDVVRFAQSNGYERDGEKREAWRYRDYVIRAFNQDKPYDQFIREQIAGDELASTLLEKDGRAGNAWKDAVVATGFLRMGVHDDEPDDKLQAEYDELDDIVGTTGAAFLGMTVACARCHDHKFDPIPQRDYYSMLAIFRPLHAAVNGGPGLDSPSFAPLASPAEIAAWKASQERQRQELETQRTATTNEVVRKDLTRRMDELQKAVPPFEWALAARERSGPTPAVQVLARGNPRSPGAEVAPGFLRAAGGGDAPVGKEGLPTAGRRQSLAEWIASPANPLTARVLVNRVWHHHFGRGLVRTTTDFGRVGSLPTHPELLDWLASEFIRQGGSIKALHRLILTSATWMQASGEQNPEALQADPANDLLWRQNLRRLDAEALRDSLLAISGALNLEAGGRGFFPALSGEVLAGGSRPGTDWQVSGTGERARRSVYAYIRRTSMVPMFEAFDYSNATSPLSERPITTVAPQALMLLNDAFVQEQAVELAHRIRTEAGSGASSETLLQHAWTRATGRKPLPEELARMSQYQRRQESVWEGLRHRLSFRPDVPDTLSVPYFNALPPDRFLVPPGSDWECHKGLWPREYEGNRALEPGRGPFSFWRGGPVSDGELAVEIVPQVGCSQVGLLLRASVGSGGTGETGHELVFEPRESRLVLRQLTGAGVVSLASRDGVALRGDRLKVRVRLEAGRMRVYLGDDAAPALQATAATGFSTSGHLGVRAWGSGVSLDQFRWTPSGGAPRPLWAERPPNWARHRAFESACLLMLNLNEVAYVD